MAAWENITAVKCCTDVLVYNDLHIMLGQVTTKKLNTQYQFLIKT